MYFLKLPRVLPRQLITTLNTQTRRCHLKIQYNDPAKEKKTEAWLLRYLARMR